MHVYIVDEYTEYYDIIELRVNIAVNCVSYTIVVVVYTIQHNVMRVRDCLLFICMNISFSLVCLP